MIEILTLAVLTICNIWVPGWVARLAVPIVCYLIGKYGMTEEIEDD